MLSGIGYQGKQLPHMFSKFYLSTSNGRMLVACQWRFLGKFATAEIKNHACVGWCWMSFLRQEIDADQWNYSNSSLSRDRIQQKHNIMHALDVLFSHRQWTSARGIQVMVPCQKWDTEETEYHACTQMFHFPETIGRMPVACQWRFVIKSRTPK